MQQSSKSMTSLLCDVAIIVTYSWFCHIRVSDFCLKTNNMCRCWKIGVGGSHLVMDWNVFHSKLILNRSITCGSSTMQTTQYNKSFTCHSRAWNTNLPFFPCLKLPPPPRMLYCTLDTSDCFFQEHHTVNALPKVVQFLG